MAGLQSLQWDIFCRVVDNLGDAGVCWRLAADLAQRGQRVRLLIDDAAPLALLAPGGAAGVQVLAWPERSAPSPPPGDVVIEAFGCALPAVVEAAMARRHAPPVWLNLEHLSAEGYVERSHGLPSPQRSGLVKHFFYPGFTPRTGGLLRGAALQTRHTAFDRGAWLASQGVALLPDERVASLFCYANAAMPALLQDLARQPTLLLLTPGAAQDQVTPMTALPPGLRMYRLPWLRQTDFDHLLWSADLNVVRGEDSLVRAIWAGAPFIWQLYPQHDGAHVAKLDAMLAQMDAAPDIAAVWRAWNGLLPGRWPGLPPLVPWRGALQPWRHALLTQPDLTSQLQAFVDARRNS